MFFTRWLLSPTRRRSRSLLAGQLGEAGLQGDGAAERLRCGGYGTANSARVFEIGTAGLSPQVTHKQPMLARWIIRAGSRVDADWSGGAPDKDRSTKSTDKDGVVARPAKHSRRFTGGLRCVSPVRPSNRKGDPSRYRAQSRVLSVYGLREDGLSPQEYKT